ncbi:hypothetical protein Plec18167_008303 [Paecilomyces lecythidis]|uniref:Uncharacterized protein n=1 Tax=Paecilomyces lecythidis TaxID=3004212 RepID=A0ABR3WY51_9EURO
MTHTREQRKNTDGSEQVPDAEKGTAQTRTAPISINRDTDNHPEQGSISSQSWFGKWLIIVEKINVESEGIERIHPENRDNQSAWDGFTIWAAANFTASTFSTGTLGPILGLGFWDSFAIIVIINFFTAILVGLFGTFGPATGLRQIAMTRYSFGIWGSRLLVLVNISSMIGWAAVNSMAGATILLELSNGRCPLWAGNLVIGVVGMVVCLFGYRIIHQYERYSWVPQLIVFCFLAGHGSRYFDASKAPMGRGNAEAASCMSFIATVYGFAAAWACNAADYNVRMREDCNMWKLGTVIWAGNFFATVSTEVLGAAFMSAVTFNPKLAVAYNEHSIGGLMWEALRPLHGFGRFLLVATALSVIQCNVINNYSVAFAAQNLGNWALKVPRSLWTLLASIVYIVFAIAGAEHFSEILESFLSVIGYYVTPFIALVAIEHFAFRRRRYPWKTGIIQLFCQLVMPESQRFALLCFPWTKHGTSLLSQRR